MLRTSPTSVASMPFARHLLTRRLGCWPIALIFACGSESPVTDPDGSPAFWIFPSGLPRLVHQVGPAPPACALATVLPLRTHWRPLWAPLTSFGRAP